MMARQPSLQTIADLTTSAASTVVHAVIDQPTTLGDADCEALHEGLLTQPVNTVTSGAFVGVGAWLATRITSLEPDQRKVAATFAALVALNGVGSIAYHGPQFPGSQTLHDLPIYGMLAMSAGVPLWRTTRGRPGLPGWSGVKGVALAAAAVVGGASYIGGRTASRTCDPDSWLQFHGLWHLSTAAVAAIWSTVLWPVDDFDDVDEEDVTK